jgi:hypothetical protein
MKVGILGATGQAGTLAAGTVRRTFPVLERFTSDGIDRDL